MTRTLHEDRCTFIISSLILRRLRHFADIIVEKNTNFILNFFFSKIMEKYW
jgi:hypothetical protein